MLPKAARMRTLEEFREAVHGGVRMGRPTLVVHATSVAPAPRSAPIGDRVQDLDATDDVRVGFVVSKAVGNAVTRNRVKRRLRHLTTSVLAATPPGTRVVVRALPRAAIRPHEVPGDLDKAWEKALHRLSERTTRAARRSAP